MAVIEEETESTTPSKKSWRKPAIIRRSCRPIDDELCKIHAELVDGLKVYRCPFCPLPPFSTQIKLRKHLKAEHPERKTLILDLVKSTEPFQFVNINPEARTEESRLQPTDEDVQDLGIVAYNDAEDATKSNSDLPKKRKNIEDKSDGSKKARLGDGASLLHKKDVHIEGLEELDDSEEIDSHLEIIFEDKEEAGQDGGEYCGICSGLVDPEGHQLDQVYVDQESLKDVINKALGIELRERFVCSGCEVLGSYIARTKLQVIKLQTDLKAALSKLRDLYQTGLELVEADLEEGGLGEQDITVRLVQDAGPPNRTLTNLGLSVGASYLGTVVTGPDLPDDGSMVQEVEVFNEESCLFISQEEWASSGLTVREGRVQVPSSLVRGVGVGKDRPRFSLSRGVCSEMDGKTFLCLDCDERLTKLGELIEHSESHDTMDLPTLDETDIFPQEEEVDDLQDPFSSAQDLSLTDKFEKLKENLDSTDSQRQRLEFKAYIHREQFKEYINDVTTLEKPFQCSECNITFASAHELWGHQVSVGSQTFDCNYSSCKEIFLKLPEFAAHYAAHGGQNLVIPTTIAGKKVMNITCPICGTVVTGLYKLQRHKMKHDAELKYKCPACPKQFVKANTLRKHIANIHKGEKAQKNCHLCDRVVFSDEGLALHLRNSHGIVQPELPCAKCDAVLDSEERLKDHEEQGCNASGKKGELQLRKCDQCHEALQEQDYAVHKEFLDKNGICPKKKLKRKPLKQSCPECGEGLVDGEQMPAHLAQAHSGVNPRFQCSECEFKLITLQGCRKHYRMVHRGAPLTCVLCKETFSKEFMFHQHLASFHTEALGPPTNPPLPVHCKFCDASFPVYMEMIIHARYSHLVQTIDITSTQLEEVTMIGGHVVEFGEDGSQIVALHTIP